MKNLIRLSLTQAASSLDYMANEAYHVILCMGINFIMKAVALFQDFGFNSPPSEMRFILKRRSLLLRIGRKKDLFLKGLTRQAKDSDRVAFNPDFSISLKFLMFMQYTVFNIFGHRM